MVKTSIKKLLGCFGYTIQKIKPESPKPAPARTPAPPVVVEEPPAVTPVWPLPRRPGGPSDEEIRREFAKYDFWHYAYQFEQGLSFSARHNIPGPLTNEANRPLQRFRHFMPYLMQACNGSLRGKRILDIACNSGFWSMQCALLGAEVVGFDGRPVLIEQANLIKSIVGINNVEFKVLDFWDMSRDSLGGLFDIVLNFGILYHLPNPLEALQLTKTMAKKHILLDTAVYPSNDPVIKLSWEEPEDIRTACQAGIIANPSKKAVELMLKHIHVNQWFEIPLRSTDMPRDYLKHERASWLIEV